MPRLVLIVKVVAARRVPLFSTKSPGVAAAGAAPRLESFVAETVPPLMVKAPVNRLVPVKFTVPPFVLVRPPLPEMTPFKFKMPLVTTSTVSALFTFVMASLMVSGVTTCKSVMLLVSMTLLPFKTKAPAGVWKVTPLKMVPAG